MKKLLLLVTILFVGFASFAQEKKDYVKDGIFYTTFESGIGEEIKVKFTLLGDSVETKIKNSEVYKLWEEQTYNNPENTKYVEAHKTQTHFETYLTSSTHMASFYAKLGLKNSDSYQPIAEAKGTIMLGSKGDPTIMYPFRAQNGYGNVLTTKMYYSESVKNGKRDYWYSIASTN